MKRIEFPEEPPHRVIANIANEILDVPVKISEAVCKPLDKGPLGEKGPHRVIDEVVKGISEVRKVMIDKTVRIMDKPLEVTKEVIK